METGTKDPLLTEKGQDLDVGLVARERLMTATGNVRLFVKMLALVLFMIASGGLKDGTGTWTNSTGDSYVGGWKKDMKHDTNGLYIWAKSGC